MSVMSCYDGFIWLCIKVRAHLSKGSPMDMRKAKKINDSMEQMTTSQGMYGREKEMADVQM